MTLKDFRARAKRKRFNTNNAWGFGGGIGESLKIGNFEIRGGRASFRRTPDELFHHFIYRNHDVTEEKFIELLKEIN